MVYRPHNSDKEEISYLLDRPLDELVQNLFIESLIIEDAKRLNIERWEIVATRIIPRSIEESWLYVSTLLQGNKEKLYQQICLNFKYCEKRSKSHINDQITLVTGIADIISTLSIGIPTLLFATILFKLGLDAFCGCNGRFRCEGITKKRHPCKRLVSHKGEFCWQHANLNI